MGGLKVRQRGFSFEAEIGSNLIFFSQVYHLVRALCDFISIFGHICAPKQVTFSHAGYELQPLCH